MASNDGGQPSQGATPPPQPNSYVSILKQQQNQIHTHPIPTVPMKQMEILHGEPTFIWDSTDIDNMVVRANLQHAVVGKFPYGMPEFKEIQKQIPLQCEFKGECKVGFLDSRHVLIRCSLLADYIHLLSRSGFPLKIQNIYAQMKTLKWTKRFNSKEETSMAIAWISFPNLPPQFFIHEAIFSIATAVGRPLQVDAATRNETRPSCAKVKVELDLLKEHPQRVRIGDCDVDTGEVTMIWVKIQYDYLPKYCKECRLQGHDEKECFVLHPELLPAQDNVEKNDEGNGKMVKTAAPLQTIKGGEPSKQVNNGRKFIKPNRNPDGWIIKTDRRRPILGTIVPVDTTNTGQATTSKNAFEALAAIGAEDVTGQADEAHAQVHNEANEDAMQENIEQDETEVTAEESQDAIAVTKKLLSLHASENENEMKITFTSLQQRASPTNSVPMVNTFEVLADQDGSGDKEGARELTSTEQKVVQDGNAKENIALLEVNVTVDGTVLERLNNNAEETRESQTGVDKEALNKGTGSTKEWVIATFFKQTGEEGNHQVETNGSGDNIKRVEGNILSDQRPVEMEKGDYLLTRKAVHNTKGMEQKTTSTTNEISHGSTPQHGQHVKIMGDTEIISSLAHSPLIPTAQLELMCKEAKKVIPTAEIEEESCGDVITDSKLIENMELKDARGYLGRIRTKNRDIPIKTQIIPPGYASPPGGYLRKPKPKLKMPAPLEPTRVQPTRRSRSKPFVGSTK